jgi:hypothetical protein
VGVYRLARERDEALPYALFGLAQVSILAIWHFPTDARLLLPLFPLLLAGLAKEVGRIGAVAWNLRRDRAQRPALIAFAAMMVPFLLVVLYNQYELFHLVPALAKDSRVTTADSLACAIRLQNDLPAGERVLTDNDPLLYLATGRQGMRMISPVINWYEERFVEGELRAPDVAREHGMRYVLLNGRYRAGLKEDEVAMRNKALQTRTDIKPLFTCGQATVFEIQPSARTASRGTD